MRIDLASYYLLRKILMQFLDFGECIVLNSDCSVRILNSACDEIHSQIQFQLHSRGFANCMHARYIEAARKK